MRPAHFGRQPETLEFSQSAHADGMVECAARLGTDENIRIGVAQHRTVDAGEPFLFDFGAKPLLNCIVGARAKVEIDQLASALAQAAADIVARDDQIPAALVLAPDDDMRVRMAGVVVIDCNPIELRPEVFLDSRHEPPGERLEVVIFYPVLGADDDAELVAIVPRLFEPSVAVHLVGIGTIELPAPAFARRTIALDVAQMRLGGSEALAAEFDGADFHDDAALAESCVAVARRQDAADPRTAPDPAAGERRLASTAWRATAREIGGGDDARDKSARAGLAALVAEAAEVRFKVVVAGHERRLRWEKTPIMRASPSDENRCHRKGRKNDIFCRFGTVVDRTALVKTD